MTTVLVVATMPTAPILWRTLADAPALTLLPLTASAPQASALHQRVPSDILLAFPMTLAELPAWWEHFDITLGQAQPPRMVVAPAGARPLTTHPLAYRALVSWPCPVPSLVALIQRIAQGG